MFKMVLRSIPRTCFYIKGTRTCNFSRSFFADSSIHACLFRSLLLIFASVPLTFLILSLHSGQYFDIPELGTYSMPHTVQFLGFNAAHRFVGMICNSPTKPFIINLDFLPHRSIRNRFTFRNNYLVYECVYNSCVQFLNSLIVAD